QRLEQYLGGVVRVRWSCGVIQRRRREIAAIASSRALGAFSRPLTGMGGGEFRAKQEDLRGVIKPKQQRDQRAGCAIGRRDRASSQVKPDGDSPDAEKNSGRKSADP